MKRTNQDVVGRPIVAESGRPDVAGVSPHHGVPAVASLLEVLEEEDVSDAALFAEFLAGDEALDAPSLPTADPIFRESLRRRLWRIHLLMQGPSGSQGPH